MKKILLSGILAIMIAFTANAQQWTQIGYMIVNGDTVRGSETRAIKGFVNDVYACTIKGLFKSTDNGDNWNNITSGNTTVQSEKMVSILVASNGNIFLGTDNKLFKSIDGGSTWSTFSSLPDSTKFWDIEEINGTIVAAYTKGSAAGVYYSGDYGTTWNTATGISSQVRYFFADGSNLFLGGTANGVYKSTDNGQTWATGTGFPANAGIWNVEKQGNKLFASSVGAKGLFSSTDNGATWDSAAVSFFADAFCQIFGMKANSSIIVVANDGTATIGCDVAFRISTDNGNTWTTFETGLSTANPSFYFPTLGKNADGSLMFTIRNNGTDVYRYGSVITSVNNFSTNSLPISIYPNPAKESVIISNLPSGSTLSVTDITGKVVYSSVITNEQTTTINTTDFTNGIYLIRIDNNGNVANRKLVVNK